MGQILRLKNILTAFDEFEGNEIVSPRDFQNYQSMYLKLYDEFIRNGKTEQEPINGDIVFEIELIKQVEVNVDYILRLVERYLREKGTGKDKEIHADITSTIDANPNLRNKKDLIEQFVESITVGATVDKEWATFIADKKVEELDEIIKEYNLKPEETKDFANQAFRDGVVQSVGIDIIKILPPISKFSEDSNYAAKKQAVLDALNHFFDRYYDLT